MIIECHYCNAKVDANEIGTKFYDEVEIQIGLYLCPVCESALVGRSEIVLIGHGKVEFSPAERLWPEPNQSLDEAIPEAVRRSLEDAKKCYSAGVFSATAVMCGRALEYVTVEKTGEKSLYRGLKKLKEQEIIDSRLFEWAEALRNERNIGAHAVGEETKQQDARDIMDFAIAFCDYVYVLTEKYNEYLARKEQNT